MTDEYASLRFTPHFIDSLMDRRMTREDQARVLRALRLLDDNEHHPSLRVHKLSGDQEGLWSASASDSLRILFERLPGGEKAIQRCTKHYDR